MDEQLFPQPQAPVQQPVAGLASQVTALATKLKLSEERYANLAKRNQITEDSLLGFEREMKAELRVLTHQAVDLRKHVDDINSKINAILGELGTVVQKHEFSTVEHYLDLWQPVQFITRDEAKRLIGEAKEDDHA
jgi:hypothetical protein